MKQLFLIACITIVLSGFKARAQTTFGPSASLNIATQHWNGNYADNYRLTPLIGFQAGIFANYKANEKIGAHAELLYSVEGTREKNTAFGGSGHIKFNFLRLPLLIQYHVIENLHVEAGPNVGLFIGGREKWNGHSEKIEDGYKRVDAGLNVGAGYDLSQFVKGVTASLRFYYGLTNMVQAGNLNGGGFKNRVISINVRYALPVAK